MAKGTCSVEGCESAARCRGWCLKHYQRWRAHGDPGHEPFSNVVRSQMARALERVDKNGPVPTLRPDLGPCWLWTGPSHPDGYVQIEGRRRVGEPTKLLHVLFYEELVGPIPVYPADHPQEGQQMPLDHLCHSLDLACVGGACFHRRCCNPAHLEPVTREENHHRAHFPNSYKTACKYGHEYTPENTYRAPSSPNRRQCRACAREHQRQYAAAKRAS